jgi:hypothetical protein
LLLGNDRVHQRLGDNDLFCIPTLRHSPSFASCLALPPLTREIRWHGQDSITDALR